MDKIKSIFVDYNNIFEYFSEKTINERYDYLLNEINMFILSFNNSLEITEESMKVNEYALLHALLEYFTDISRLKTFHGISRTNEYKIIAYETYWILRRKPIQILSDQYEELVFANEKFVLSYIMSFLTKNFDFNCSEVDTSKAKINCFIDSLYYYLKYRVFTPQELEMILLAAHTDFQSN